MRRAFTAPSAITAARFATRAPRAPNNVNKKFRPCLSADNAACDELFTRAMGLRVLGRLPPARPLLVTAASWRCRAFQETIGPAAASARCETPMEMETVVLGQPIDVRKLQLLSARCERARLLVACASRALPRAPANAHPPAPASSVAWSWTPRNAACWDLYNLCVHLTTLRLSPRNVQMDLVGSSRWTSPGAAGLCAFRAGSSSASAAAPPASPRGPWQSSKTENPCAVRTVATNCPRNNRNPLRPEVPRPRHLPTRTGRSARYRFHRLRLAESMKERALSRSNRLVRPSEITTLATNCAGQNIKAAETEDLSGHVACHPAMGGLDLSLQASGADEVLARGVSKI